MSSTLRTPYLGRWKGLLAGEHDHEEARSLISKVQSRYQDLYDKRDVPDKHATRITLERAILPTLAIYQVLLEETGDQDAALRGVEPFLLAAEPNQWRAIYSPVIYSMPPPPFFAYRRMLPFVAKLRFPAPYMDIEFVENNSNECRLRIKKCFFLDTLEKYGAIELTKFFCAGDDRMYYESLPPSMEFIRTKALANGDEYCDHTFRKVA